MKKLLIASSCMLAVASAFASGPANPMENYTPSNVADYEVQRLWRSMRTDVKGKDCYRRAHLWAYDMYRNHSVKSSKIFIHYTDKFNRELDNLGREKGLGWLSKKTLKIDGVSKRTIGMIRSNITWDYHVAPMLNVGKKKMVMDRYLSLPYDAGYPYTESEAWKLVERPATVDEWVEALTVRGELLWQARRQELINEMAEKRQKASSTSNDRKRAKYVAEYRELESNFKRLGMDKKSKIDIKCKKITSIVELDRAQSKEWCFYSFAPMYYYNEIDLRYLAYGETGQRYHRAVDPRFHTEENFREGRRNYVQTRFNEKELEDASKEIKYKNEDE